ncbi:MAG: TetR/AcrR family transcriptional regulator [Microbacterium sp.]|uniref:TetR/AcrR family transcriptional regulator n=1 Tax=Microbacterium sp. TaxID=51671 RepID=UPI003A883475
MTADLEVRPPQQERSQVAWNRVLDAGVAILDEIGYTGFTIAAVCKRAGVTPPAIYARVRTKKALYLAVFERGFCPIRAKQVRALDPSRWTDASPGEAVRAAIAAIVRTSLAHEAFFREIALRAEVDPEVAQRTHEARVWTADLFRDVALRHPSALRDPSPDRVDACFRIVFAALMARIAVSNALDIGTPRSDDELIDDLQETAVRFLFSDS